jgi:hypothetical protein
VDGSLAVFFMTGACLFVALDLYAAIPE